MLCLSIYLILIGLISFVPALAGIGMLTSVLALAAGILILMGK
jgi:hypothetical protein